MKHIILPILALFLSGIINAQQRDLDYYLEQAKINSPLIRGRSSWIITLHPELRWKRPTVAIT